MTANSWHSCSNYTLVHHFGGKDPVLRRLFNAWLNYVRQFGPVTVIPQKTRIVFMVRMRFGGASVRAGRLECRFLLRRRVDHPALHSVKEIVPGYFDSTIVLRNATQLKAPGLRALVRESYLLGCQDWRARSGAPRAR